MVPSRRRRVVALSVVVGLALGGGGVWAALQSAKQANGAAATRTPEPAPDTQRVVTEVATDTPAAPRATPSRPQPPPVIAPARARLSLSTQPPGTLFLDERRIRSTPIINFELAPGRHRVQVKRDGFAPFDTVFTAEPGQEIKWTRRVLKPIGG